MLVLLYVRMKSSVLIPCQGIKPGKPPLDRNVLKERAEKQDNNHSTQYDLQVYPFLHKRLPLTGCGVQRAVFPIGTLRIGSPGSGLRLPIHFHGSRC